MYKVRGEINRCFPVWAIITNETQLIWSIGHIKKRCRWIWFFPDAGKIKIITAQSWIYPEYKLIFWSTISAAKVPLWLQQLVLQPNK